MSHPNETLIRQAYALFATGDIPGFTALCTPDLRLRVPGKNALSGEHGWGDFLGRLAPALAAVDHSFREEVQRLAANETDGFALVTQQVTRGGRLYRWNTVHHWGIREGKLASFTEFTDDEATFNAAWGG